LQHLSEKKGGNPTTLKRTERLNHFLSSISGESIVVNGKLFTLKKHFNGSLINELLDRGIARMTLLNCIPTYHPFIALLPFLIIVLPW